MTLVGDAFEWISTARAGSAGSPMHDPVISELGRQATGSLALELETVVQHRPYRRQQIAPLLLIELGYGRVRRQSGAMQDVVAVSTADARNGSLISQPGVDP